MLFGDEVIKAHFKGFSGKRADILQEEYFPTFLSDQAAAVYGQIVVKSTRYPLRVVNRFTFFYRVINGEIKLAHQHNSYEYIQDSDAKANEALKLDINTTQYVRSLLLDRSTGRRLAVRSGTQTVYFDPYTVLYVQSQRKRTELVCIDRVISCNSPIGELAKTLPDMFYPLHRCYLVNTLYIVAIRRFEVELISGISIPIPALNYTKVKQALQEIIER